MGELRRSAAVLLVAKEEEEKPWFTSAGQSPTATTAAMAREGGHGRRSGVVQEGQERERESIGAARGLGAAYK